MNLPDSPVQQKKSRVVLGISTEQMLNEIKRKQAAIAEEQRLEEARKQKERELKLAEIQKAKDLLMEQQKMLEDKIEEKYQIK